MRRPFSSGWSNYSKKTGVCPQSDGAPRPKAAARPPKQPERLEALRRECGLPAEDEGKKRIEREIDGLYGRLAASLREENARLREETERLREENARLRVQVKNLQS